MILEGRNCELYTEGKGGPVFFLGTGRADESQDALTGFVREMKPRAENYSLLVFGCADWDQDFAPWEAYTPDGRHFAGGADETVRFLTETAIPYVKENIENNGQYYTIGYSLSALFALYAVYQTDMFAGCACVSGSLWFPHFMEYTKEHRPAAGVQVYLSLGGKEPNSKDTLMKTVGDCYKQMEKRLKQEPRVSKIIYEMNPGGHFGNADKRMAKGIVWLLNNQAEGDKT